MLEFLSYFQPLIRVFSIISSLALLVMFIYILATIITDKQEILFCVSYFLIVSAYTMMWVSNLNPEHQVFHIITMILTLVSMVVIFYYAYVNEVITLPLVIGLSLAFLLVVPVKILLGGTIAWIIASLQIVIVGTIMTISNIRFLRMRQNPFLIGLNIFASALLVFPLIIDALMFYIGVELSVFVNQNIFSLVHFISMFFICFNNPRWFKLKLKKSINSILYLYIGVMVFTSWVYYMGIYYWTRFVLLDIFLEVASPAPRLNMGLVFNFPMVVAVSLFTLAVLIILIIMSLIFKDYKKEIERQSILDLNEKIFNSSKSPLLIIQSQKIYDVNQAFEEASGYSRRELISQRLNRFLDKQELILENEIRVQASLLTRNLETHEYLIHVSQFINEEKPFQFLIFEDLAQIHKELEQSVFYNNVLQILISDSSWNVRLKQICQLAKKYLKAHEVSVRVNSLPQTPGYGTLPLKWMNKMEPFLLGGKAMYQVIDQGEEQLLITRLGKMNYDYGYVSALFSGRDGEAYLPTLNTLTYILTQFVEADYLYNRLLSSENTYKILVENSVTGIFIYQENKVIYINGKFLYITGFTLQDMQEADPWKLCENDFEQNYMRNALKSTLAGSEQGFRQTFRSYRKDKQEIWLSVYLAKIIHEEKPAVIGYIMDRTQQVEVTRQRKKMTDLLIKEQRMTTMRNLVRGIAHEFNNVFAIIKGYTELLMLGAGQSDQDKEDIKIIYDTVKRGMEIANRMHIFAKQEKIEIQVIEVDALFQRNQSSFSSILRRTKHDVQLHFDIKDKGLKLMADEFSLEHVFHNLLFNALDASKEKGHIAISVEKKGDEVQIIFEDDGKGIPQTDIHFVFDPFFTTKEGEQGAGLGLYICHEIILSMHGEIFLESEEGEYTRIFINLPLAE